MISPVKIRRRSFVTICGALLMTSLQAGCASSDPQPPGASTPQRSEISFPTLGDIHIYNEPGTGGRMLQADPTTIWRTLPRVYEALGVPIEVSNEAEHQIGNTGYRARRIEGKSLSNFLDCGLGASGPRADNYDVTLFVATRLIEQGPAETVVQTTVDATARPRAVSGNSVQCASRGNLEMRVAELIVEALGIY